MRPTDIIGNARLYHADCRDVLPCLKGEADMGATDAPYLLTSGGNKTEGKGRMKGKFALDNYDNSGSIVPVDITWEDWLPLMYEALSEDADCYVMANDKHVGRAQIAAESAGFRFHNLLVWRKDNITANRWYMKDCEFTLYLWKGRAKCINNPGASHYCRIPAGRGHDHPTQKPVALMRRYIENSSQLGETVLDPFMGSGTTGIAAYELGRSFIGIEKSAKYYDLTCERISHARENGCVFAPREVFANPQKEIV